MKSLLQLAYLLIMLQRILIEPVKGWLPIVSTQFPEVALRIQRAKIEHSLAQNIQHLWVRLAELRLQRRVRGGDQRIKGFIETVNLNGRYPHNGFSGLLPQTAGQREGQQPRKHPSCHHLSSLLFTQTNG